MNTQLIKVNSTIAVFTQKINNIHFNYTGVEFYNVHKMTEKLYEKLLEHFDDFSEKIRMGGDRTPATMKEHLELSFIKEETTFRFTLDEVISIIVNDLTEIIAQTQKIADSPTIQPLLDELYVTADKYRWLFGAMKR